MFRAASLSIIRSYLLYYQHWHILCRFGDLLPAGNRSPNLPETCRIVLQKYIWNYASVGFIQNECIMMYSHMHIKIFNDVSRQPVGTILKDRAWTAWNRRRDKQIQPETSVENHQNALRNIPEERGHHLHCEGYLKFSQFPPVVTIAKCRQMKCLSHTVVFVTKRIAKQFGYRINWISNLHFCSRFMNGFRVTDYTASSRKQWNLLCRYFPAAFWS